MHQMLDQQQQAAGGGGGSKPTVAGIGVSEATVEHVVSCDEDVLAWLDSMGMLDAPGGDPEDPAYAAGAISDYSDILFDLRPPPSSSSSSSSSSKKKHLTPQGESMTHVSFLCLRGRDNAATAQARQGHLLFHTGRLYTMRKRVDTVDIARGTLYTSKDRACPCSYSRRLLLQKGWHWDSTGLPSTPPRTEAVGGECLCGDCGRGPLSWSGRSSCLLQISE